MEYRQLRQQFYSQLEDFWHDLYGAEYALFDVKVETPKNIARIRQATERIGAVFYKTALLLRQLDDETLLVLGFPHETLPFLRLQTVPMESVIARFDLVVTGDAVKLLELNADTPTFIKETFAVNGQVCQAFGVRNPNDGCEEQLRFAVTNAVRDAWRMLAKRGQPSIAFASHRDHVEDYLTTKYLQKLCELPSQLVDFGQLRVVAQAICEQDEVAVARGLYTDAHEKIDVLYRQTYPIEHVIRDEDPHTTEKVGQQLLQLVADQEVALLNPLSAFLLQSKAILAVIWGLHEQHHTFYTDEEHEWIAAYFLPAYLDADIFLQQKQSYVKKPCFGREGDTVEIYSGVGYKVAEDANKTYVDEVPVYQQFIELPTTVIQTVQGAKRVHYMYGCFYIGGQASAIGIRAGNQITDNASYFLPIGVMD